MSYKDVTIKEIVTRISNNEVYMPAIQRKFVWSHNQIEKLFDSIMLGYPIGTFLFWDVEKTLANNYTFYKFVQEYHERDNSSNELAPKPEMKERIVGVLDGQQRLSSLYLALQGSYAYKKPRARWDNNDAFPKRHMYLNLLHKNSDTDDDENVGYDFKFLTDEESKTCNENHFWFPVKSALAWKDATDYITFAQNNDLMLQKVAIDNLTLLWQRITQDKVINYFEVKDEDLDSILEIFIRVNSGGTVLSKSDLLFSTIVANWEQAREEVEMLLKDINSKGQKFDFDNDFIMRACLVLTDCPVLFNVNNFQKENVIKIRDNWGGIKQSLKQTVDLLVEYGFNHETLTSRNAIIPISYFLYHGGLLSSENKGRLRKYLIISLLKQIYGGKGDQVLESIRSVLRSEHDKTEFPLKKLINHKLPLEKSLAFSNEDLNSILDSKKGPYTFMALSLLYPHLKLGQVAFHQDHIHPASSFSNSKLKRAGIEGTKWVSWQQLKDTIVNLQLLEGRENEAKNNTPFEEWYNALDDKDTFRTQHYIPDTALTLANFDQFVEARRELLIKKFREVLQ